MREVPTLIRDRQQRLRREEADMHEWIEVLSRAGSTRATAYPMSAKIVTWKDRTHVAWQRAADHATWITTLDLATDKWSKRVHLGPGDDNHGGPALTVDSRGCLHVVFGPHDVYGETFRYRRALSLS